MVTHLFSVARILVRGSQSYCRRRLMVNAAAVIEPPLGLERQLLEANDLSERAD